jgi:molecular chaperone GrpE (heat shock protein)
MPDDSQATSAPPTPVTDDEARLEAARAELIETEKQRQQVKLAQFTCLEAGDRAGSTAAKAKITSLEDRLAELLLLIEGPVIGGREQGLEIRAARGRYKRLAADLAAANQRTQENGANIRAQAKLIEEKQRDLASEIKKLESLKANGCGRYEADRDLRKHIQLYSDLDFTSEAN